MTKSSHPCHWCLTGVSPKQGCMSQQHPILAGALSSCAELFISYPFEFVKVSPFRLSLAFHVHVQN